MIFLYGSLVGFSSFFPDPVALSSAEAKYNTCCHACMALAHVRGIFLGIEGLDPNSTLTTPIILDSKSAQAMGNSFRDTAHTRHIMRRYHYVRHPREVGQAVLHWCEGPLQLADIGTKNLPADDLARHHDVVCTSRVAPKGPEGVSSNELASSAIVSPGSPHVSNSRMGSLIPFVGLGLIVAFVVGLFVQTHHEPLFKWLAVP